MVTNKKISAVAIAYRDAGNIEELYRRLSKTLKSISPNYEIVYVNDSSPDESQEILERLAKKDKRLTVLLHSRNFGAQNAFTTGMKYAIGDAVVIMDGDLQDPPQLIEKFVKKWLEGFDVVYGIRQKREKSMGQFWESIYHLFYVIFNKLSYIKAPLDVGDFSLMDRKVVDHINALPENDRFIRGLRAWVGFSQTGVAYTRPERFSGQGVSTNSIFKGLAWARKAIFSFSYAPLEWVFYLALVSVAISFLAALVFLVLYFYVPSAPHGFMTTILAILFTGCVQISILAIICEYLRRIFEEVKRRPVSIVKKIINVHNSKLIS